MNDPNTFALICLAVYVVAVVAMVVHDERGRR